jgi:type IV secretory pathway TraG/TraD family ATPase VirD4
MSNQLMIPPSWPPVRIDEPARAPREGRALGTACWHELSKEDHYESGDFYLGHGPDGHAVGFRDDRHVLLVCGNRGGKGASYLVPNLAMWPGSALVIDPKGENAMVTARRRGQGSAYAQGMGQTVHILDPYGEVSVPGEDFSAYRKCFNPLDLLGRQEAEAVPIAGRIADSLVQADRASEPHWEESARTLIRDLGLHVASWRDYKPAQRNLVTLRQLLRGGDRSREELARLLEDDARTISGFELLFDAMKRNRAFGGVVSEGGAFYLDQLRTAPRTLAGVISTAARALDFLDDPQMRACVSRSDFRLSDLKTDPKGVSLYVCLPQRLSDTHAGWLRMFAALTIGEMERTRTKPASGHPVLTVLDEFPALRRMRVIENAAAQIAGFGVKMVFVAQTLAQLKDVYKDNWETMVANAGVKIFFGNDDQFTREYVSKLAGDTETVRTAFSGSETDGWTESFSLGVTAGESQSVTNSHSGGMGLGGRGSGQSFNISHSFGSSQGVTAGRTSGRSGSRTQGYSESVHKRALLTPDEVGRLFASRARPPRALVLVAGRNPFVVERLEYHRRPDWRGRYDRHRDHPAPITRAALPKLIADEKRALKDAAERRKREEEKQARENAVAAWQKDRELVRFRLAQMLKAEEQRRERLRKKRLEFLTDGLVWMAGLGGGGLAGLAVVWFLTEVVRM